jgi:hypothetical protein
MVQDFAEALMAGEADAMCGAGYGERSPERVNIGNVGPFEPPQVELNETAPACGAGATLTGPEEVLRNGSEERCKEGHAAVR